jgi:dipeptidyl aminopeptidase/acylaminoacyl peptidase
MVAKIQNGLSDEIVVFDTQESSFVLVWSGQTDLETWDSLGVGHGEHCRDLMALGMQSGTSRRLCPTEIYAFEREKPMTQLSQHGQALTRFDFGRATTFDCKTHDGTIQEAILVRPSDVVDEANPRPTVVLVHGGPYSRITIQFNLLYFYWGPYLVNAGYTILCPNYRGGSGRGENHASQARGGMGTKDYSDIISLVRKGISMGLIDAHKVAIGGYSQGGFLSYIAVTREDFHFKAAVCGAGVTDWDMMTMSSITPWLESECAGCAPWETTSSDTKGRHGSPIWHMKDAKRKTPILILHGEADVQVPVTQAVAFHRGCLKYNWPCEMVTYPRGQHVIGERKHVVDMMKRIRRFYDLHLK